MSLKGIKGDRKDVDRRLLRLALDRAPSIFVDASNCANIHRMGAGQDLSRLFIIPAESLYRFKPTLLKLRYFAECMDAKNIFISSIPHLFDYDDPVETRAVIEQCWKIIRWLSKQYNVIVGIIPGSVHDELTSDIPRIGGDSLGHTVWSQRIMTDIILKELEQFAKALRVQDRHVYLSLLKQPLKHMGSITFTSSQHIWAFLLLSIILEQQKTIESMKDERLDNRCIQGR